MTESIPPMVEAVARAIDPVAWRWLDNCEPDHPARPVVMATQFRQARAAIAAMREPAPATTEVGVSVLIQVPGALDLVSDLHEIVSKTYRAMIDAARGDTP